MNIQSINHVLVKAIARITEDNLDETIYVAVGPGAGPSAVKGDNDAAKMAAQIGKALAGVTRGKLLRVAATTQFGVINVTVDYANIPNTSSVGSLDFLNAGVQVRLWVSGFDKEGNVKGTKVKLEKLTPPRGLKIRAKTGTPDQVAKYIVSAIKKAVAVG